MMLFELNCWCGQLLIGQTRRNQVKRFQDHVPNGTLIKESDIAKHQSMLQSNSNQEINFDFPEIFGLEQQQ